MSLRLRVNSGVGRLDMGLPYSTYGLLLAPLLRCGCFRLQVRVGGWCPSRRSWFVSTGRRLNPCRAVTVRVYVVRTLLHCLHPRQA